VLVAAAVCPHPPLLVPELAAGAAHELDGLRGICDAAVASLCLTPMDLLVVVGTAPTVGPFPDGAWGSVAAYGVDVRVGEPSQGGMAATLPLSLTIATWLLDRQQAALPPRLLFGVAGDTEPERCAQLGSLLADRANRVGMLVMGDASARRSLKGPGYLDPRAEPFDLDVAAAFRAGDADALAAVDPALAADLLAAGRPAWQVLAGAAAGRHWQAELTHDGGPYGVTYLVATWTAPT
jgi:hypothetical protein